MSLSQGLALLPLRDVDMDAFLVPPLGEAAAGFLYLFAQLSEQLQEASKGSPMAYIETDYFGGIGSQAAIVFVEGRLAYGALAGPIGVINGALRLLGVEISGQAHDEFEAVGLSRYRHNDAWLQLNLND